MRVLCFGSLNIDYTYRVDHFVRKGETLASDSLNVFSGGKGLNQSIALARAGLTTCHAGAIGEDGRFLLDVLNQSGVDTENIAVLKDIRTGNAIIQNDRDGDNCILLYGGANQAVTREQVGQVLARFEAGDYLVLQNEINEIPYIVEKAHEKGMKIVLNPSPMNEKIMEIPLEFVDYFLLNEVEAGQILGREAVDGVDGETLAAELLGRFPNAAVVLTLGQDGSVYADRNGKFCQPIYPVQTVDTTAAGDTFTGYFIAGILKGKAVREAMDMAARAASIAVTRSGAAPSIPTIDEVVSGS